MENFLAANSFNIYLNMATGLWGPPVGSLLQARVAHYGLLALALVSDVVVYIDFVIIALRLISYDTLTADRCIGVFILIGTTQALCKMVHILIHRDRFQRLFELCDGSAAGPLLKVERRRVKLITSALLILLSLPAVSWSLSPLVPVLQGLHGGRYLAVPAWFPFDPLEPAVFPAVVLFQTAGAWFKLSKTVAFDGLFLSLVSLEVTQLRVLSQRMREMFPSDHTLNTRDELAKHRLDLWIQNHQRALLLGAELQAVYSSVFLVQFFSSLVIVCFASFVVLAVPLDSAQFILCAMFALSNMAQLFLLCYYGDRLVEESAGVSDACYDNDWESVPLKTLASSVRIVLLRSQTPLQISAVGVYPLGVKTFYAVAQTAFSYTMVLSDIYAKE